MGNASTGNGVYAFDSSTKWAYLTIATIGLFFFSTVSLLAAREEHFGLGIWILGLGLCAPCIYVVVATLISSQRTLEINDIGVFLRNKKQRELRSLRWPELGKLTERRRWGQLVLWDKAGARRTVVDQQFERFSIIRSRLLDEYAKVFQVKPFPTSFGTELVLHYETVIYLVGLMFCGWMIRISYHQGEPIAAVFFWGLMLVILYCFLNLYPQLRGQSELYADRLILHAAFKTDEVFKRDVTGVEITDVTNARSGTKFSLILLHTTSGKDIKVTSKYGSIPEIYLTLRSWLNR